MHPVLPHKRCQNHSETTIKAVKIYVRKGLVVSYYHTRWEWSLFVPFLPGISIRVHHPLEKQWNTSILQSSREVHTAEQRPRSPRRHSCYESVKGRHCRAVTCEKKAEELPAKIPTLRSWCDKKSPTRFSWRPWFPVQPLHLPSSVGLGSTC